MVSIYIISSANFRCIITILCANVQVDKNVVNAAHWQTSLSVIGSLMRWARGKLIAILVLVNR